MNSILEFLRTLIVDSILMTLLVGLIVALFFIWLNRNDSRVDRKYYDKSFKPDRDLAAHIFKGDENEVDPEKALKAYSQISEDEDSGS